MPISKDKISISQLYHAPLSQVALYPVLTIDDLLLADPKRRNFFTRMSQHSGLEPSMHQALYESTITQFVELVQALPYQIGGKAGGLLDYSLERAGTALRHYRQSAGTNFTPLYAYALFTAALFQDVGKIISQQAVMISDAQGKFIAEWNPFEGSMVQRKEKYYKLRTISNQWLSLGQSVTPLLARQCMPPPGFEWIASDYKILAMWMGVLTGDAESEGELIHWLQLAYKMIGDLPKKDQLPGLEIKSTRPVQTAVGEDFIAWLSEGLGNGTIPVNTPDANVHVVLDGLILLQAGIFKEFQQIYGKGVDWMVACKQFNCLGYTKLSGDDLLFDKFFSKTTEAISAENAARAPKAGMFFNLGMTGEGAANVGMREGLVARSDLIYGDKPMPGVSNLASRQQAENTAAAAAKNMAIFQNKLTEWTRSNPMGKPFYKG